MQDRLQSGGPPQPSYIDKFKVANGYLFYSQTLCLVSYTLWVMICYDPMIHIQRLSLGGSDGDLRPVRMRWNRIVLESFAHGAHPTLDELGIDGTGVRAPGPRVD